MRVIEGYVCCVLLFIAVPFNMLLHGWQRWFVLFPFFFFEQDDSSGSLPIRYRSSRVIRSFAVYAYSFPSLCISHSRSFFYLSLFLLQCTRVGAFKSFFFSLLIKFLVFPVVIRKVCRLCNFTPLRNCIIVLILGAAR